MKNAALQAIQNGLPCTRLADLLCAAGSAAWVQLAVPGLPAYLSLIWLSPADWLECHSVGLCCTLMDYCPAGHGGRHVQRDYV